MKFNDIENIFCEGLTNENKICKKPISKYFYFEKYAFIRIQIQEYFENKDFKFMEILFEVFKNMKNIGSLELKYAFNSDLLMLISKFDTTAILKMLENCQREEKKNKDVHIYFSSFKYISKQFLENLQIIFDKHENQYQHHSFDQFLRIQIKRLTTLLTKLSYHKQYHDKIEGILDSLETESNEIIFNIKSEYIF